MYTEFKYFSFLTLVRSVILDSIKYCRQLITKEDRDDGGRCFVSAESVVVTCGCNGKSEQILIIIDCLNDSAEEEQELCILVRCLAG